MDNLSRNQQEADAEVATVDAKPTRIFPASLAERQKCRRELQEIISVRRLLPPVPLVDLLVLVDDFLALHGLPSAWRDWCVVYANNVIWEPALRRIPLSRRLLLLPICLRHHADCQATYDDLGLVCSDCGRCQIPTLLRQAGQLGLLTLVAESSSRVAEWVEAGEIEAVIGVSCLDSLSKAFPAMNRQAIPGYAIPLNGEGCRNTNFDLQELQYALGIPVENPLLTMAWTEVKAHQEALFQEAPLRQLLACSAHQELAQFNTAVLNSLSRHGKHYRPLLTFLVYLALSESGVIPPWVDRLAVAVECFHKASLIHDDIEDDDDYRYGEETVHYQLGVPVAINVGDYLIGEGYRLLTAEIIPAKMHSELAAAAAEGHCQLALGQAREFELEAQFDIQQAIETFRLKTAPAFRVAFLIGAIAAGQGKQHQQLLAELADTLGVAYQLLDDLNDQDQASIVTRLAAHKQMQIAEAEQLVQELYQQYRRKTQETLAKITNMQLKMTLARVTENILPENTSKKPAT